MNKNSSATLMTNGPIWKRIIAFAIPLFFGNLFQQLYNTVDSIVVGNYVSKTALAAVGSTDCIINTIIGFFSGLSTGAGVVISHNFGSRDDKALHCTVHTTIALTLVLAVFFTIAGLFLSPFFLRLMDTPEDVLPESSRYLTIYFAGVSGLMLYNMGAGILRAVGDSTRPLYILIVCAVTNIILDLVFVIVFHMGVSGVAYATIISQWISAILVLSILTKETNAYKLVWKDLRIDKATTCLFFASVFQQDFRWLLHPSQMYLFNHTSTLWIFLHGWMDHIRKARQILSASNSERRPFCHYLCRSKSWCRQYESCKKSTTTALIIAIGTAIILMFPVLLFAPT